MLTVGALLLIVYLGRRPLIWFSTRMIAFSVGFVIGWRVMDRR